MPCPDGIPNLVLKAVSLSETFISAYPSHGFKYTFCLAAEKSKDGRLLNGLADL